MPHDTQKTLSHESTACKKKKTKELYKRKQKFFFSAYNECTWNKEEIIFKESTRKQENSLRSRVKKIFGMVPQLRTILKKCFKYKSQKRWIFCSRLLKFDLLVQVVIDACHEQLCWQENQFF